MKKTIVYLIRHAEQLKINGTKYINEEEQVSNEKIILSINGEIEAKKLSQLEELKNIDVLWSSNYVRAISTAKYIAEENNLLINVDSNFNERKLGDLNSLKELGKNKTYTFTQEQLLDDALKNVDGESRYEVSIRMRKSLSKILKENNGQKIAIVSHGAAIKFLLMNWCKLNENLKLVYNNIIVDLKYPSVIKLEFIGEKLENLSVIK